MTKDIGADPAFVSSATPPPSSREGVSTEGFNRGERRLVERLRAVANEPWFKGGNVESVCTNAADVIHDLYAALKAIDDMWSDDGEGGRADPIDARSGQVREIWQQTREALAKARGKASQRKRKE